MSHPTDLTRIIAARAKLAQIMVDHNRPQFAPILHRLTAEKEAIEEGQRAISQAREILREAAQ